MRPKFKRPLSLRRKKIVSKLRSLADNSYNPTIEELHYIIDNYSLLESKREKYHNLSRKYANLSEYCDTILDRIPSDIVFANNEAYDVNRSEECTNFLSLTQKGRSARTYLNAHDKKHWGLHVYYNNHYGNEQKFMGCFYPTRQAAEEQAISWILHGRAIKSDGTVFMTPVD